MKRVNVFLVGLVMILTSLTLHAQKVPADYFVGKWEVKVEGTPNGDITMNITIERNDGALTGYISGDEREPLMFSKVEEVKGKSITTYFSTPDGYDISLFLEKKDDNSVKGSVMDMFDANGKRVIDKK